MANDSNEWDILEIANRATQLIEKNFKVILGICIVAIVCGSAFVLKQKATATDEMESFNTLFVITKVYQEKKADFAEAKTQDTKKKTPLKEGEKKDTKVYAKSTGDLTKDYGEVITQLEGFIASEQGKNASGEAALILSEIYEEYKEHAKGADAISKALTSWGGKGLLFQVLNVRAGDLWASSNNCDKAVPFWQKVATDDSFVSQQAQLKMGVCFQELGRVEEAKTWLNKVKAKTPNSTDGFNAKRYLRYIQFENKTKTKTSEEASS